MKKYRFTKEDRKILLTHKDANPEEIRDAYFPHLSTAAVTSKLKRLLDGQKFNNSAPWEEPEIKHLAANINMRNREIQKTLFRPKVQINMMRWAIRHNRLPKKLVRRISTAPVVVYNNTLPVKVASTDISSINQRVQQIGNESVRKAAEAELRKAISHFGNVEKLLDVNELVSIN